MGSAATFQRWMKYNAVGVAGIVVQWGVLACLVRVAKVNYLVATAVAVEAALLHNFVWHQRWTWVDRCAAAENCRRAMRRLIRFNLSNGLITIVGNLIVMRALVGECGLNVVIANMFAIVACSL